MSESDKKVLAFMVWARSILGEIGSALKVVVKDLYTAVKLVVYFILILSLIVAAGSVAYHLTGGPTGWEELELIMYKIRDFNFL